MHPFVIRRQYSDARSFIGTCIRSEYAPVLPLAAPMYIVDAGAYTGDCSALMLTRYPDAKLVALEPKRDAYQLALRNLSHYPNAMIRHEALWSAEGGLACNGAGMGASVSREQGPDTVPCSSMPRLLCDVQFPRLDLFKCDIEGAEVDVFLNGDLSWLQQTRCVLIELHSREAADIVHAACTGAGLGYAGQYRSTHVFRRLEN
jgi:FkbM family methyltransferase